MQATHGQHKALVLLVLLELELARLLRGDDLFNLRPAALLEDVLVDGGDGEKTEDLNGEELAVAGDVV